MFKNAILTLNAGSSTLKAALYSADLTPITTALIDRIGAETTLTLQGTPLKSAPITAPDHHAALDALLQALRDHFPAAQIGAVGHRVVHGGPDRAAPERVTPDLLTELATLNPLAPLHQPHNLAGIRAAMAAFPQAAQIACFDTAFHRTQPWVNDTYALPREFYDRGIRRYGFHGLSYSFIAQDLRTRAPDLAAGRVIVLHLGNGASACAMRDARAVSSTMGFSPLDGLPMGTRPGQIDPGVILYLADHDHRSAAEISDLLYRKSGLLALSNLSSDMRQIEAAATPEAEQAIDYFCARIRREIGALTASLEGVDGIVFTGGIGENSPRIRAQVCDGLGWLGVQLDAAANQSAAGAAQISVGKTAVWVVPTDEERIIAQSVAALTTP